MAAMADEAFWKLFVSDTKDYDFAGFTAHDYRTECFLQAYKQTIQEKQSTSHQAVKKKIRTRLTAWLPSAMADEAILKLFVSDSDFAIFTADY